jgi:septal ring factor EnvC (AmiA/AmiB activator)
MAKESITIRLQADLIDVLEKEAGEESVSRSEYVRQILQNRHESDELADEVERLRDRLESREQRIDGLEEQLARRSQLEEKVDTLAKQQEEPEPPFFVKWLRWYRRQQ